MKLKRTFIPLSISIILNICCASLLWGLPKVQFSLVYTNDVMGEVEPCG